MKKLIFLFVWLIVFEELLAQKCRSSSGSIGQCVFFSECQISNWFIGLRWCGPFVLCCPNKNVATQRPVSSNQIAPAVKKTPQNQAKSISFQKPIVQNVKVQRALEKHLECGMSFSLSQRIIGGSKADSGYWPWMAAIIVHFPDNSQNLCGGTLIDTRHILTAAHCTLNNYGTPHSISQYRVHLGDTDLRTHKEPSDPIVSKVIKIVVHPKYKFKQNDNDIAILVLDKPVKRSKFVSPICLPNSNLNRTALVGLKGMVVGYGETSYRGTISSFQKQVELPIWENENCKRAYRNNSPISDNMICAGYPEGARDACQGDSGSPIMLYIENRWVQIGIVSFGEQCALPNFPGVYTYVPNYLQFIKSAIKK